MFFYSTGTMSSALSVRHALRITRTLFTVLITSIVLGGCGNMFVYHPTTDNESALIAQASRMGLEAWPTRGEERMGWRAPPPNARQTGEVARLLAFHGNAGHSLHRDHFVTGFQSLDDETRWEVFLFEYPGYGSRPGNPSEETIMSAARDAIRRLRAEDGSRPVYLLGESLGSGVATQLAAEFPRTVPGILLVTPFTNLADVGAAHFPRFLVRTILRDRYDSEAALSRYDGRAGFLLAGQDEVVTTELGRKLYDRYHGAKALWVQEQAGHNTLDYSPRSAWWSEASGFLLGR